MTPPWQDPDNVSRFVNIIKGCNNFCTFCVVPYTRGREKSRPQDEILAEVASLVRQGTREIVLLGQNVNSYGLDRLGDEDAQAEAVARGELPFADLLYEVARMPGVERLRFTTSNPHDFTPRLAKAFAALPVLCSHFHLPLQSGSDRILRRMNRKYTRTEYFERVRWLRDARPDMAFTTDIIVGFPGETEEEFEETLAVVREMRYASLFAFKYSPRPGTPAARFRDRIPEPVQDERLQRLLALQKTITEAENLKEVGQDRDVLILYRDKRDPALWCGRTSQGRLVRLPAGEDALGRTVRTRITGATFTCLTGE